MQMHRAIDGAAAALHDPPSRLTLRMRCLDLWRWFRIDAGMLDGDEPTLAVVLTDVTTEMTERLMVQASEKLYQSIWESLPGLAVILDADGRIIEGNPAWCDAARRDGARDDAYVGESYLAVTRRGAEGGDAIAAQALAGITRVLHDRHPRFTLEYECTPPSGEARWFHLTAIPLRRAQRGALIVHSDATAASAADLELKRQRDQLAHMHRLSTMNELATSIAHELNQPLATITASASAAYRVMDTADIDELRPIIDDMREAAMRAAQVMRAARAMVRRRAPEREFVELNETVSTVTRLAASDLLIHQITLTTALAGGLPAVTGDRVQLQQVVLNLLLNAVDAVASQPLERRAIAIATRAGRRGWVELSISDSGPGICPTVAATLFDPFTTTKHDGTGLGLSIVRAVVEAHGGRIAVESSLEGGAAFRVSLPLDQPEDSDNDFALSDVFTPVASRHRR
jgi:signal transduction histidine kinase